MASTTTLYHFLTRLDQGEVELNNFVQSQSHSRLKPELDHIAFYSSWLQALRAECYHRLEVLFAHF